MLALSTERPANGTLLVTLLAAVLLIIGWNLRVDRIDQALPYCQHPDEHTWVSHALRIVRTGDLNPRRFTKPSLMVYLNAIGVRVGMLSARIDDRTALPKECYPYFEQAALIRPLRLVYAGLSLVSVVLAAFTVRKLARLWTSAGAANGALLLTIALSLASPTYLRFSSWYLNVDILGCWTAMAVIAFSLLFPGDRRPWTFVLLSAVLSGACIGTKYNLFPVALGPVLALVFFHRQQLVWRLLAYFAVTGLVFFCTTPYALLDSATFLRDVNAEIQHYATGSGSPQRDPGIDMFLAYGGVLVRNFSPILLALAVYGLVDTVRRDFRRAAIVFAYPLVLWLYMSAQRTFYERNLLILQLVVPMLAGLGVLSLFVRTALATERRRPRSARVVGAALGTVLVLALVLTWPRKATADVFQRPPESRNLAVRWLERNAKQGSTILVASELDMDTRPLKARYRVLQYDSFKARASKLRKKHEDALVLVPLVGSGGRNMPLDKARVVFRAGKNPIRYREQSRRKDQQVVSGDPKLVVVRL